MRSSPVPSDGSMLSQLVSAGGLIVPSGQDMPARPLSGNPPAAELVAFDEGLIGNGDSGNSSPGEKAVAEAILVHLDVDPHPQGFVVANTLSG